MDLSNRSVKAQFKLSDREAATHCLIVGDSELADNSITMKDLKTGQQSTITRSELLSRLRSADIKP
jgi:histidyl-tRNA synthetase